MKFYIGGGLVFLTSLSIYFYVSMSADLRRPNVLVLSVCSLASRHLTTFGSEKVYAPSIEDFMDRASVQVTGLFNGLPWINIINYLEAVLTPDKIFFNLYEAVGDSKNPYYFRVPKRKSDWRAGVVVDDNEFEKDVSARLAEVEGQLRLKRERPFFSVVHFKYLHYPLIDRFNSDSQWDRFLTPVEKDTVVEYLTHPERYGDKIPMLLLLTNNPRLVLASPKNAEKFRAWSSKPEQLLGLVTNAELLQDWQNSHNYAGDIEIVRKIYRANLAYFDQLMKPFLNLWNDPELQKNTIVIFMGDHGESHMERGELSHALSLWDESLRVPFAAHFPGSLRTRSLESQLGMTAVSRAIADLISGPKTPSHFTQSLRHNENSILVARNCSGSKIGLRYKGQFKYFVDVSTGEKSLYDLNRDPGEKVNLAETNGDLVAQMDELTWRNIDQLKTVQSKACAKF